jgi:Cu(I)/Ag(I) efflux system protein CusF
MRRPAQRPGTCPDAFHHPFFINQLKETTMKSTAALCLVLVLSTTSTAFAQSHGMPVDMKETTNPKGNAQAGTHKTSAVVKATDVANGKVTLSHGAIASLNWPPMIMPFTVRDKRLFDKLTVGKTVNVELVKEGRDYVITAVR